MKLESKQVIAFVLGAALGALLVLRLMVMPYGPHGIWRNPEKMHRHMMQQFTSKLELTVDQQQKVSAILDNTRVKVTALRQEMRPKFDEIRNTTKDEIQKLLTPDQRKKFDILTSKMEARMAKRRAAFMGRDKEAV